LALISTSGNRTRRIIEAGVSAIFSKGIVLLVNAVSIPIVVRYLGPEQFGIWVTVSTTLALLVVLDLGIASALTNLISEAYAKDSKELAAHYATSAFWTLIIIAGALGLIGFLVWPRVAWGPLFHLTDINKVHSASHAVAIAFFVFLLGLPAGLGAKILGGYQELRTANVVSAIGSVANLIAVALGTHFHAGLAELIGYPAGAVVVVNVGCLCWIWFRHKPWLAPLLQNWNTDVVRRLLAGGTELFVLQLAGLVVFNSDNFVILHYLGPVDVTPYSVTWKLVGYAAALQIIITPALWPAYAEAFVRRDIQWIRQTLRAVMVSTMLAAGIACLVLILWGKELIRLWAGPAAVPHQSLIVAMCVWILLSTFTANASTVLLATNTTRLLATTAVISVIVNLGLSIWLVQRIGSIGVIIGTILSYTLIIIGPQTWKVLNVLRTQVSAESLSLG
jgi:O-antigen/teichoic acid export membrane protein